MTTTKDPGFRSQADAVREARLAIWGDVTFAKRECILPEPGVYGIHVTANVNGHLVDINFDNYGRVGNGTHGVKRVD